MNTPTEGFDRDHTDAIFARARHLHEKWAAEDARREQDALTRQARRDKVSA